MSKLHTVEAPRPAVNSWAPYSAVWPVIEVDQVKVMVEDPVEVMVPYQSSSSAPTDPVNCTALCQVVTPPPDTAVSVVPEARWAKTTSTSPRCWVVTAIVVIDPVLEVKLPTALIEVVGVTKVNWSLGGLAAEVPPPGVVTVTSTVPADSAGEVMEIEVGEFTTRPVPALVPKSTVVAPVKPVPVSITGVPPPVEPLLGLTPVTVGAGGVTKVNWSAALVVLVPAGVVTVMSTVPNDPAGEVALSCPGETSETLDAGELPKSTSNVLPATKPVPVTVTTVPPVDGPEDGLTEVTVGLDGEPPNATTPAGVPRPVGPL